MSFILIVIIIIDECVGRDYRHDNLETSGKSNREEYRVSVDPTHDFDGSDVSRGCDPART